jgi:hypothetical protein
MDDASHNYSFSNRYSNRWLRYNHFLSIQLSLSDCIVSSVSVLIIVNAAGAGTVTAASVPYIDRFDCCFRWRRGYGSTAREPMRRTHWVCTPRRWDCTSRYRTHTTLPAVEALLPGWRSAALQLWGAGPATRRCSRLSQGPSLPTNWLNKGSGTLRQVRRVSHNQQTLS